MAKEKKSLEQLQEEKNKRKQYKHYLKTLGLIFIAFLSLMLSAIGVCIVKNITIGFKQILGGIITSLALSVIGVIISSIDLME